MRRGSAPTSTPPCPGREICAPTRYYKTGVVFLAWLNGFQKHFVMLGGAQSARPLPISRRSSAWRTAAACCGTRSWRRSGCGAPRGLRSMRDFAQDLSAAALNTATLGGNVEGAGAGWAPERIIDACAARGLGGVVFWRREIGTRAAVIGARARAAGVAVAGLCRAPFRPVPSPRRTDAGACTSSAPRSTWRPRSAPRC